MLRSLADNSNPNSLAAQLRRKRFAFFTELLSVLPRPVTILDVGGTQRFWEVVGFTSPDDVDVTLLNVSKEPTSYANFRSVVGDARAMHFNDKEFDVVFSNSVIEHVGRYPDQARMAREVMRVGKRYFVQTPNRNFPIEPHFLFPLFQFLPVSVRIWLLRHMHLGWHKRTPDAASAREQVEGVQLMNRREFTALFPGARLHVEPFGGLQKSFIVYGGWTGNDA
jgi:hypothetical protein